MQLNPSEISDLIKQKIEQFDLRTEARTEGTIVSLSDGIVRVHGLSDASITRCWSSPATSLAWP